MSAAPRPADAALDASVGRLELLAVSDDLTGAAALAGEFHAAGLRSYVAGASLGVGGADLGALVVRGADLGALVVDSRSRQAAPDEAARLVVRALQSAGAPARSYYKRIDSALRGNVAAELRAIAGALDRPLVLAPAAPALGVVTRQGTQRLAADPVDRTHFGLGADAPPSARPADLLPGSAVELGLDQVRKPGLARLLVELVASGRHVVCDAESEGDLGRVASALAPLADRAIPVGSYGLGRAWAAQVAGPPERRPGVLVAVGSLKAASRAQVRSAREQGALTLFEAADAPLEATASLARGRDVILVAGPEEGRRREDPAVARRVAERAVQIAAEQAPSGLVLVGGELSSEFFRRAGARAGQVVVEPWPAAPVVRLHGGILEGQRVLTKSGAQGDEAWLDRALALMRALGSASRRAVDV